MKKTISLLVALLLCTSVITPAFAAGATDTKQYNRTDYITTLDENGNYVQYSLVNNSTVKIPIYAQKESNGGITANDITEVATLTVGTDLGQAFFNFTPLNILIGAITLGFTGSLNTRNRSGQQYGAYSTVLPVSYGCCASTSGGTAILSGTYTVIGYTPATILQGFST